MKGVVFTGGRELELMQFDDPSPGSHDVVIEMKASGMCGSDCISTGARRVEDRRPGCRRIPIR